MQQQLKWYDYVVCVWLADIITAGLFSGNLLITGIGVFVYDLYESWRKNA